MPVTGNVINRMELFKGDITKLHVDAIVNAANNTLLGGGGVDGAIHRAAGPGLLQECRELNGCATGEAKYTRAYNLPAEYVIHTVGPVWHGGIKNETHLLTLCYTNSLEIAHQLKLNSITFPAISTGAYRFPVYKAAAIAVNSTARFLSAHAFPQRVIFACFDDETITLYQDIMMLFGNT
ncbi:MAG: O-acetyl-ADP-ribose deacetylase [Ignavibacteria bacterium]|nr:O-acetyl-ADP-ribose deacetylase [Ignavibacteria bacterium]